MLLIIYVFLLLASSCHHQRCYIFTTQCSLRGDQWGLEEIVICPHDLHMTCVLAESHIKYREICLCTGCTETAFRHCLPCTPAFLTKIHEKESLGNILQQTGLELVWRNSTSCSEWTFGSNIRSARVALTLEQLGARRNTDVPGRGTPELLEDPHKDRSAFTALWCQTAALLWREAPRL